MMDCRELCTLVGALLGAVLVAGLLFLMILTGEAGARSGIMSRCDKVGEFTVQEYTYECKLKEE